MKNAISRNLGLVVFFSLMSHFLAAQTIIGGGQRDPSAVLELKSEQMGLLLPRLTTAQRNAIPDPATGLILYNLSLDCMEVNIGPPTAPQWVCLTEASFSPAIGVLQCDEAVLQGALIAGVAATGVSASIPN